MFIDLATSTRKELDACDVAIVGAGAAGITLALELEKSGLSVAILEGGQGAWTELSQNRYQGEVSTSDSTKWTFWVLAMIPFAYILFVLAGELKASGSRETGAVASSIKNATRILLVTWLVYPIGYLFPVIFNSFAGDLHEGAETARQLAYTVADITAKALYGLMILNIAKARSGDER